eukprot:jgi/Bigna1/144451/aug1.87_g19159
MSRSNQERLSRKLTLVLRHKALEFGLKMTPAGYVKLDELLKLPVFDEFQQSEKRLDKIEEIVENCKKQRFRIRFFDPSYEAPQLQSILEETKLGSYPEYKEIIQNTLKITMEKLVDSGKDDKVWKDMVKAGIKPGHMQKIRRHVGTVADDMKRNAEYYIRANQGHSIKTLDDAAMMTEITSADQVEACIHGTYWDSFESISALTLRKFILQYRCYNWQKGVPFSEALEAHEKWFHEVWGNLKSWYLKTIPQRKRINGIKDMLQSLEMKLEGRHHNGIDDCKNMAKICGHLLGRSLKPFVTGSTDNSHMRHIIHGRGGRGGRGGAGGRGN